MMKTLCQLLAALACLSQWIAPGAAAESTAPAPAYDPIERYAVREMEGWRVLVNQDLLAAEHQQLCDETLKLLGAHLYGIARVVPAEALAKLRQVPIWVELAHPRHPCMCYHPDARWLRDHGMNPEKAGAVEIANARNFLTWTRDQPWMVLHELAHAYHDRFLGFDHAGIRACFDRAMTAKRYESVLRISGRNDRAYAATNPKEYFAEATEAFFGTNDFFPFVRAELKQHDPALYELLEELWEVRPKARRPE